MGELVAIRQPSVDEMLQFAESAVKSKFYGFSSADQLLPLMMVAQSQGRPFASVVEEYSVINNRPALKAEAMLARFQKAGGHIQWTELTDARCAAIFSHAQCAPVEIDWDMDRAKQAQLTNPMWKKYPRNMLKARVISDGVRTAYPACLGGLYTPEEHADFEPTHAPAPLTPARGQLAAAQEEPGQVETPREQPSISVSFTAEQNNDGIGKGKSSAQAKKDGDWNSVRDRLDEEMRECSTRAEALEWWDIVVRTDEEYRALPSSWRQLLKEEVLMPYLVDLPEVIG